MTIREITPDEYSKNLKNQIQEDGIIKAVREQLDEWVSICHQLGYLGFAEAMERAQTIMDLLNTYIALKRKYPSADFEREVLNIQDKEEDETDDG